MSQSKSNPQNTTSNATSVDTTNNNISGNSGLTLANTGAGSQSLAVDASTNTQSTTVSGTGNGNQVGAGGVLNIVQTDDGAIAAANGIASRSLSAATTAFGTSASVAQSALDSNTAVTQEGIDAATGISQSALALAAGALTSANATNANSLDTINTLASGFATQLQGVITSEQAALQLDQASSQTQLGNVTNALTSSFIQGSTSANQTVVNALQSASDNETKVFMYVALAAAVVAAAYFLTRKG